MNKELPAQMLSTKIAETVRHKIIVGELVPGTRLSEAALSEQLDISRNTLREVFRMLTQEGLLRYEPNRGVYVAVPDMADILDIYRIRRLIECDALAHAYPLHPAVAKMEAAVEEAREHCQTKDWRSVGTANIKFHTAIVELTDSERLAHFYRNISAELRLAFGSLDDAELLYAPYVEKNAQILALLINGNNVQAAETLADYLDLSERTVLAVWSRHNKQ
ncbi:GntR family transcriptional regulator [Enterobacter kobei]